jgi:hypothetical protein
VWVESLAVGRLWEASQAIVTELKFDSKYYRNQVLNYELMTDHGDQAPTLG